MELNQIFVSPPGYYCKGGQRFPCPSGTYANNEGTTAETCNGPCQRGMSYEFVNYF